EDVLQSGGENVIKVILHNRLSASSTVPLRKQIWGWRNYGGILRPMFILVTPRMWVDRLAVTPSLSDDLRQGMVHVQATIGNRGYAPLAIDTLSTARRDAPAYSLIVELVERAGGSVVGQSAPVQFFPEPERDNVVSASLAVSGPKPWSPESPDLYTVRAVIAVQTGRTRGVVDEVVRTVGFSHVKMESNAVVVNGKRSTLRRVVWHEDFPGQGASLTVDQMVKEVELIKSLGANAVRFGFHPPHPLMIELCSRAGIFVFQEIPVWNAPAAILADEGFQSVAEAMVRAMVQRDLSQPSILAWGIGVDFDSSDPRVQAYVERMTAAVRSLDGRPVYYGTAMLGNDRLSTMVDIAAISMPAGDLASFRDALTGWKERNPGKPLIVLSYGKTVESKNRNGYSDPLSEEAQARYFIQRYAAMREIGAAGSFIEAFADWRGDRPLMTLEPKDPYMHPLGLLSYDREKRLAFDVVRSLFAQQKIAALPVGNYRAAFPAVHIIAGFAVIFLIAYYFHYNRRFGETFKRALLRSYNFFADLRDLRTVAPFHTFVLSMACAMTLGVVLSGVLYFFRTNPFADSVISQIVVSDIAKEFLVEATWNPVLGILVFTGMFLVLLVITAMLIRIFSVFVRRKVYWFHAFTVAVWGALPLVFLSPVGMSLFKILATPAYVLPTFLVILIVLAWVLLRVLKGISVVYDVRSVHIYAGGLVVVVGIAAGAALYLDAGFSLRAYVEYLYNLSQSAG
ncbi:MAG: glycoside hydrolase family 2 TIM barrel-domain containing protein, partial [Bacteroidota bacterium]